MTSKYIYSYSPIVGQLGDGDIGRVDFKLQVGPGLLHEPLLPFRDGELEYWFLMTGIL